ncbi:hypothetical protein P7K49_034383 [Saguinus oedipus]|uniref:Uncharacterized protein n=1 Tax=Saguinus oedipus TaxID=9490 RepID=A0ABQ9TV40_SAGOE|nr:hypothetical protein P7K49_034383 [Saguinus oedipus]
MATLGPPARVLGLAGAPGPHSRPGWEGPHTQRPGAGPRGGAWGWCTEGGECRRAGGWTVNPGASGALSEGSAAIVGSPSLASDRKPRGGLGRGPGGELRGRAEWRFLEEQRKLVKMAFGKLAPRLRVFQVPDSNPGRLQPLGNWDSDCFAADPKLGRLG